ncbi:MAG TPA: Npt1/Npt2 family nucleotide transporter, partial [Aggregatilineales bacterium]|nr:Npt1/Npt2 family nucleotide transporter [Aggregatilineales bacterium]
MLGFLSYLFDIRKGEWNRLLLLYLFGLIFLTGITWGETISEAAFLAQVGTGVLPYTFIADAVIAVFAVAIYTVFVDRVGHDRLLIGIMLISAVIVLIGRILVGTSASILAYPFLYLGSHVIKDLFILHWWTYVNSFYDTQSAKRVVPFIATGARVAGIVAGFSMALLNRWLAPENIIFLWMGSLVLVALGVTLMPRLSPDDGSMPKIGETAKKEEKRGWRGYVANIREGVGYVRNSPYLRWIAISTLLLMTLLPLITYQTSQILKDQLQSTAAISSYVGNLTGITNLIMFPIQLFLMGRLIRRLGLGNTNMIYPTGTLLAVGSLVALPTALFSAGFAYFYRTTFRTSFRMTIDNLLYNAVPLKVKGRARAFTTGLLIPVGYLIGGILLLTLPALRGLPWLLPAILAALGIAYFLSSFIVTRLYSKALVTMLEQEDYSFLLQPAEDLNIVNIETMERLKKQAEESTSPEMTIFIAKLMSDVGGKTSIPALVGMARSENPTIRAAIANILIAADFRSSEVRGVLTNLLSDPEGVVRQSAVSYLSQWSDQGTDEIYGLALELLRDPEPEVRLQVIPILIRSGDIYFMAAAMQALSPLLTDSSPARRGAAVRLLAQFRDSRFIQSILPYMNDPDDEVRLEAAVSVEMLSERALPVRIERMLLEQGQALLTDPVERIRRAALVILGNLRLSQAQSVLISFLTDSSAEIRDTAVKALARGSDQITLTALLRVENQPNQLRKMLTVVLGKIDKEKAIEPIRAYIRANLIQVYTNLIRLEALEPCIAFQGISIIANLLRERNELLLEESFYLLSALHPPAEVQVIAESLVSDVARVRANAFEALETVLTPVLGRMFKPLYDKDLPKAKLLEVSHEYSGVKQGNAGTVLRTLGGDANDHWVRAIVVYALGEIGATAYPPPPDDAPSHEAATVISPKPSALPAPQAPLD